MWSCEATGGAGFNTVNYCNDEVDALLKEALIEPDREVRIELYTEMQNIILEDLPVGPLVFKDEPAPVSTRVHNLFPNSIDAGSGGYGFNAKDWWIEE